MDSSFRFSSSSSISNVRKLSFPSNQNPSDQPTHPSIGESDIGNDSVFETARNSSASDQSLSNQILYQDYSVFKIPEVPPEVPVISPSHNSFHYQSRLCHSYPDYMNFHVPHHKRKDSIYDSYHMTHII